MLEADVNQLCVELHRVAQALTHQQEQLEDTGIDFGLRSTVIVLIDRNHELVYKLMQAVQHPYMVREPAAPGKVAS